MGGGGEAGSGKKKGVSNRRARLTGGDRQEEAGGGRQGEADSEKRKEVSKRKARLMGVDRQEEESDNGRMSMRESRRYGLKPSFICGFNVTWKARSLRVSEWTAEHTECRVTAGRVIVLGSAQAPVNTARGR